MKKVIWLNLALIMGIMVFHPVSALSSGDSARDLVIELASGSGWQMVPINQDQLRNVGSFCIQETPLRILCKPMSIGSVYGHVSFTKSSGSPPQKITAVYEITHHGFRGSIKRLPSGIVLPGQGGVCEPPTIQHSSGNGSLSHSVEPCLRDTNGNEKPLKVIFR